MGDRGRDGTTNFANKGRKEGKQLSCSIAKTTKMTTVVFGQNPMLFVVFQANPVVIQEGWYAWLLFFRQVVVSRRKIVLQTKEVRCSSHR